MSPETQQMLGMLKVALPVIEQDEQRRAALFKREATLVAEFALAGVELVKMGDGTWLATRWGMFKPLATEDEARAWLARVTGKAA